MPRGLIKIPRRPAKPHTEEIGSKIEAVRRAFDALGRKHRLRFIHDACLHVGLDPLMMASPAVFGLADEEPEVAVDLPTEVAPASDGMAEQAEQQDDAAELGAEDLEDAASDVSEVADEEPELAVDLPAEVAPATDVVPMELQAEQQDGAAVLDAEDLPVADNDVSQAPDQESSVPDLGAEDLQHAGDDDSEAADQEPGGAMTCAYCNHPIKSGDGRHMINGRLYHDWDFCLDYAKKIARAAA